MSQLSLTCLLFSELPIFREMIPEVPPGHDIYHQVQVFSILECLIHVDNEWIEKLCQYLSLIHN